MEVQQIIRKLVKVAGKSHRRRLPAPRCSRGGIGGFAAAGSVGALRSAEDSK